MNKLIPAKSLLYNISLIGYIFLLIRQLVKPYFFDNSINYNNVLILVSIYIYESLVAIILKESILYRWNIKHYIEHHILLSIFMLINYNLVDLENNFINMQKYGIYINCNEVSYILQNMNISNKYIVFIKLISLYNLFNLIYYEIVESYTYYKSTDNYTKYLSITGYVAVLYHIIIVLPSTLKFIKKNLVKS